MYQTKESDVYRMHHMQAHSYVCDDVPKRERDINDSS